MNVGKRPHNWIAWIVAAFVVWAASFHGVFFSSPLVIERNSWFGLALSISSTVGLAAGALVFIVGAVKAVLAFRVASRDSRKAFLSAINLPAAASVLHWGIWPMFYEYVALPRSGLLFMLGSAAIVVYGGWSIGHRTHFGLWHAALAGLVLLLVNLIAHTIWSVYAGDWRDYAGMLFGFPLYATVSFLLGAVGGFLARHTSPHVG